MNPPTLLQQTAHIADEFVAGLAGRRVGASAGVEQLRHSLAAPLPDEPVDPAEVVSALARAVEPGLVASAGPRYFGFVTGGSLPAALAADWLTSAWDQNAGMFVQSPAMSVVEEVAAGWILDLLGFPSQAGVGFVTGATMANFTGLAAGRHEVLRRAGWDVEQDGLQGAPHLRVVAGAEAHATVFAALRLLGLGSRRVEVIEADEQGRMRADRLGAALRRERTPTLVCAQAGNVNTGAFDPLPEIADLAAEHGAWLHVDGAFGLWAAASPARREQARGVQRADSCATDGHKWLNVPYDSGLVIVADAAAHRAAMSAGAAYFVTGAAGERDGMQWAPEFSRRARALPIYAALRSLGRRGVADLIERCCRHAARLADLLRVAPEVEILNEVVLNQVLVRFRPRDGGDADEFTRAMIRRVQGDGTCWAGGTTWRGRAAMRLSVSGWMTSEADIEMSAAAILRLASS